MPIPRSAYEWESIVPNETDRAIAREGWKAGHAGGHSIRDRVAAASRLHEQERCVERLAKALYAQFEALHPSEVPDMDWCVDEARRILGCEPESKEESDG